MLHIEIVDWCGRSYLVQVNETPRVGDDVQVGYNDDKRVRGIVSRVERTIGEFSNHCRVYLSDNENSLNDGSSFEDTRWWSSPDRDRTSP